MLLNGWCVYSLCFANWRLWRRAEKGQAVELRSMRERLERERDAMPRGAAEWGGVNCVGVVKSEAVVVVPKYVSV